jgi:hypothetical protein
VFLKENAGPGGLVALDWRKVRQYATLALMKTQPGTRRTILTNRRVGLLVAVATVLGLCAFFVADNFVLVEVRILTFELQVRLAWALVIAFWLGAVSGVVGAYLWWRRQR